jgi:hypothetical protein
MSAVYPWAKFYSEEDCRLDPCWEVNPVLWGVFCRLSKRDPASTSPNWTELDCARYVHEKLRRVEGVIESRRQFDAEAPARVTRRLLPV